MRQTLAAANQGLLTSLNHDAFCGLGAMVTVSVLRSEKPVAAVAGLVIGLTTVNIDGVALATWISRQIGWHEAYGTFVVVGALTMAAFWLALRKRDPGQWPEVAHDLRVLTRPEGLTAVLPTALNASAFSTSMLVLPPFHRTLRRLRFDPQ